ncbi:MAG: translation initiation factor IF-2 [Desulfobacterales bacterium]
MAKIRVYELARDLNMTNKELIDKLTGFGFSVGNHMSSLEEDTVTEFKSKLLQKPAKAVEETRVKPTVIRRRKKVKQEPAPPAPQPAEVSAAEQEVPVETEPAPAPQPAEAAEKPGTAPAEPAVTDLETREKQPTPTIQKPRPPLEKQPEVIEPEPERTEETALRTEAPAEPGTAEHAAAPEKAGPVEKGEEPAAAPGEKITKRKKPEGKKRRAKKDMPAKIIKMGPLPLQVEQPEPLIEVPPQDKQKEPAASQKVTSIELAQKETEEEKAAKEKKKKKGRAKRPEAPVEAETAPKKKIAFRKKAIVEGDELYSFEDRTRKLRKGEKGKRAAKGHKPQLTTPKAIKRRIKIDETIVLSDLAKRMGIKASEIIKKLMGMGVMTTVNQPIEFDTAALVAAEFDYEVEKASFEEESIIRIESDDPEKLVSRPPVVTVMGHVDHGKTSLLDVIRKTSVTEQEAGGITQHIGAYHVTTERGRLVFLDTPGHEAFTAMRSRGASVTDIVILVVAADDGVMPQTLEAINHSKAADVPIIVAVNKIDKSNADPDRVLRGLSESGLTPEDWGGDTIFVRVSAKTGEGIDDLLEMVLLQAELMELKANPDKLASGHVVEAKLDSGRGAVATVLVQDGTLHSGDPVVCGMHYGKIRALVDDRGNQVKTAGPSMPVEIIGLTGVPNAGDEFVALADEKNAKQVSSYRIQKQRSRELSKTNRLSLENLFEQMQEGEVQDLNIILKADVHGSIEALKDSLVKLSNEEVKINIVHSATGAIAESDVSLAAVSDAIIIGFNVRPNAKVQALAAEENVDIRFYDIIYNVIKDVQDAIVGMMASTFEERILGTAEVREVFHVPKVGAVAGSYVTNGKMQRGQKARLIREGIVLYDGRIGSLRRFKDDVREVQSGFECGIGIEKYNDIKVGDIIECYYMEEIKPEL